MQLRRRMKMVSHWRARANDPSVPPVRGGKPTSPSTSSPRLTGLPAAAALRRQEQHHQDY